MAYRGYGNRSYQGRRSKAGLERALEHIRQAEELSEELGGTDEDVKRYFFSLSERELRPILDEYESCHGPKARAYADETLPKWRSGLVHMSGMVASRLFSLLPPKMSMEAKYDLVRTLWDQYCPRSNKVIRVGPDADVDTVVRAVRSYLLETVTHYTIPEPLERRFEWLAAGDVQIEQQLLNHFMQQEKDLIVEGTRLQLPTFINHLQQHGDITHKLSRHIQLGKHELEIAFDSNVSGVSIEDPPPILALSHSGGTGCLTVVLVVIALAVYLALS